MRPPRAPLAISMLALVLLVAWAASGVHAISCPKYDTVEIQLKWLQQAQFAGYLVALERGYYREQCIEAYVRPGGPSTVMAEEVLSNRAQFGIDWLSGMLAQREAGRDVVLIAQAFVRGSNAEMSWADSQIREPRDLIDKNVCVWLGGNELNMRALFDSHGMIWDTDTSVNRAPNSSANIIGQSFTGTEFLARRCDAAATTRYNELAQILATRDPDSPTGALFQEEQLNIIDFNAHNVSTLEDGIFASRAWLEREGNRDIAVRFLRASLKGWLYARDFPLETNRQIFSSNVHQQWMNNEVSKLVFPHWDEGFGVAPAEVLQASADRAFHYGMLTRRTTVDEFYRSDIAIEAQAGYDGQPPDTDAPAAPAEGGASSGGASESTLSPDRRNNWAADPARGILGSADFRGASYVAPSMRFCHQSGQLSLCIGARHQSSSDYLASDSGGSITLQTLAGVALLSVLLVTLFLVAFRHERAVVASSLPFCLIISLGASLFVSSVFLSTGLADTVRCHARIWLICVGFILMMGSFVIKVRRIDAIFNNKILAPVKLTNDTLYRQVAALLAVELVLLALFSGVSGYEARTYNDEDDGNLFHTRCQMSSARSGAGPAMVALLFAYKGCILAYSLLLAYWTRDVQSAYNESRYLAMAVYNLTIGALVVVPIVAFVGLDAGTQIVVADIGIVFAVTLSFMLLFVPKIWQAYQGTLPFSAPSAGTTIEMRQLGGGGAQQQQRQQGAGGASRNDSSHQPKQPVVPLPYPFPQAMSPQMQRARAESGMSPAHGARDTASPPPLGTDSAVVRQAQQRWTSALKQMSREVLLSQLHMLGLHQAVVRAELASRGLTQAQIDEALTAEMELQQADSGLGVGSGLDRSVSPPAAGAAMAAPTGTATTSTARGGPAAVSAGSRGTTGGRPSISSAAAAAASAASAALSPCAIRCSPPVAPVLVGLDGRRSLHTSQANGSQSGVSLTPGLLTLAQLTQLRTRAPPQPAHVPSHFGGDSLLAGSGGGWGPEWSRTTTATRMACNATPTPGPGSLPAAAGAGAAALSDPGLSRTHSGVYAPTPSAISEQHVQLQWQTARNAFPSQTPAADSTSAASAAVAVAPTPAPAASLPTPRSHPSTPLTRPHCIRVHIGEVHPLLAAAGRSLQLQMQMQSARATPMATAMATPHPLAAAAFPAGGERDADSASASASALAPSSSASSLLL